VIAALSSIDFSSASYYVFQLFLDTPPNLEIQIEDLLLLPALGLGHLWRM
jgi:hypothetical protein